MNEWIKFKDQKPPVNVNILVFTDKGEMRIMWKAPSDNCFLESPFETVRGKPEYWRFLPSPPGSITEEVAKKVMKKYGKAIKGLSDA